MRANPKVKALGTSCAIFSGSSSSSPSSILFQTNKVMLPFTRSCNYTHTLIWTSVEPTDAGFVSWSLLFSSCIHLLCFERRTLLETEATVRLMPTTLQRIMTSDSFVYLRIILSQYVLLCRWLECFIGNIFIVREMMQNEYVSKRNLLSSLVDKWWSIVTSPYLWK